ncbi:isoprenyl transferase [Lichenibacterium ramalinae]|uniref:Isoprenyl transferase n=1 Tax=Lichenibacterium ramalinae TaxID=2316527 RepID=A0A4Q2RF43_9HYPH|nr:isoprenyl transferase [Lichenibacterium ramalinae]RYB05813.1 isoprenyl transferase [Lichenibacterium ramalinae]
MQTTPGDDGRGGADAGREREPGFGSDVGATREASRVPAHVGIIMDGNGRWAAARGMPRLEGHRRGVEALRATVKSASDLGVRFLTVYSFSSENWTRPVEEVSDLMGLLKRFIRKDLADLHRNGVRVRIIGERDRLTADIRTLLADAEELTRANAGLVLVVAFNYGSRQEIASAMRRIAEGVRAGTIDPASIGPETVTAHLDTAGIPDPDLIIRTSGEQRLSNFLMWQAAYAEFVFLPCHWPDFDRDALQTALEAYMSRERRFGGIRPAELERKVKSAQ